VAAARGPATARPSAGESRASAADDSAAARRERRRLQHQDLNRSQLLDAAEVVFGSKGFANATLKEIAELAGFAVGSVYSFFPSKDELFRQVLDRRGQEFVARMEELCVADTPALDRLHALVDMQVGIFREHPHFSRLYVNLSHNAGGTGLMDEIVHARFERAMTLQTELIEDGQRQGQLREGDPLVLARIFSGIVFGYQSLDPRIVSDDPKAPERMPLSVLHAIIERAMAK
jgi:TetR/AcrR family transcriptional regulator